MKNPWIIIGIITVVLFGGAIWFSGKAEEKNNEGIELVDHIKGNSEAVVSLVEYSDLQCPACAGFQPVVKTLLEEYGDQIRFEYKHFPLPIHQHAVAAAVAAEAAAQQGMFFEFHDLMFENQSVWASLPTPTLTFMQYADQLGLDMDLFRRHLRASVLRDRVMADLNEGVELGVSATPTFFLNGQKMTFRTYQEFTEQVAMAIDPSLGTASGTDAVAPAADSGVRFGL